MRFVTLRQGQIWDLARHGFSESVISTKLRISRQSVHIMLNAARNKVVEALNDAAQSNRIQVRHMDVGNGILAGYNPELNHKVVITYSPKNNVKIWYSHDSECQHCKFDQSWVRTLLDEADERGIKLTTKELRLPPAELAKAVFGKILPGVEL